MTVREWIRRIEAWEPESYERDVPALGSLLEVIAAELHRDSDLVGVIERNPDLLCLLALVASKDLAIDSAVARPLASCVCAVIAGTSVHHACVRACVRSLSIN